MDRLCLISLFCVGCIDLQHEFFVSLDSKSPCLITLTHHAGPFALHRKVEGSTFNVPSFRCGCFLPP